MKLDLKPGIDFYRVDLGKVGLDQYPTEEELDGKLSELTEQVNNSKGKILGVLAFEVESDDGFDEPVRSKKVFRALINIPPKGGFPILC